ncbi:hypothetical protein SLEP1_g48841 [Rubroshorea leprosula]|uniref:Uncharacterized protein n=1 Tax=Rubroshorea leprosula TaxID=152421 RepID=A0AAV5LUX6_9ROSI|nr:hypothetical protein SLEP1_g48841 [Rubroshorea leprosula]
MKREGRQYGMVRTYYIPPPPLNLRRDVNLSRRKIDSPATAGLFTKVSPKPTNHSKFTGKCGKARCGGCHMHPVCKSKDKTKGNHRHRSTDMHENYQVMDGRPGLNFSGLSVSAVLEHLASNHHDHDEDDEVDDNDDGHDYDFNMSS